MLSEIVAYTLGFLCASVLMYLKFNIRSGSKPEDTPSTPGMVAKFLTQRPDNTKARSYATNSYYREKEEAVTRGEGYPE